MPRATSSLRQLNLRQPREECSWSQFDGYTFLLVFRTHFSPVNLVMELSHFYREL